MLCVKTKIGPSKIHGIGLFADQPIRKGAVIWRFTPGFDIRLSMAQVKKLPKLARDYLMVYAFTSKRKGYMTLPVDNGKYFNHSETPNTLSAHYEGEEEVVTKAIRNIKRGEELTDNYATFDKTFRPGRKSW